MSWILLRQFLDDLAKEDRGDPLTNLVEPGVATWRLALGNLFRTSPSSPVGMAFAALANAAFLSFILWLLVIAVGFVRRKVSKPRS